MVYRPIKNKIKNWRILEVWGKNSYVLLMVGYSPPPASMCEDWGGRYGLCIYIVISNIREVNTKLGKSEFSTHILT